MCVCVCDKRRGLPVWMVDATEAAVRRPDLLGRGSEIDVEESVELILVLLVKLCQLSLQISLLNTRRHLLMAEVRFNWDKVRTK